MTKNKCSESSISQVRSHDLISGWKPRRQEITLSQIRQTKYMYQDTVEYFKQYQFFSFEFVFEFKIVTVHYVTSQPTKLLLFITTYAIIINNQRENYFFCKFLFHLLVGPFLKFRQKILAISHLTTEILLRGKQMNLSHLWKNQVIK